MQVMETYSPDKDQPDLITYVAVEAAHESDANALLPAVAKVKERGLTPEKVLVYTVYGSDENVETAKAQGVEVVAPVMGKGNENGITLADFEFSGTNEIIRCTAGNAPERTKVGKKGAKAPPSHEHSAITVRSSLDVRSSGRKSDELSATTINRCA